ncbi:hypothetical protein ACFWP3_02900 [Streptomyces sp. NPDC058525]|uniref:hypothetical protein n=1 Tax=Streptomyces sp. NPDC058525 TaxID=3346538 RepID=UPI003649C697
MGQTLRCTSYPARTYAPLLREAGLNIVHEHISTYLPDFPGARPEEHLFIHARKPSSPAASPFGQRRT